MSKPHLTPAEIETFRDQLRSLVKQLEGKVSRLEAEALRPTGGKTAGEDEQAAVGADPGVRETEEVVALALLDTEGHALAEANAALARIEAGTFGVCESCGQPIAKARLKALPYARFCIRCAT